MNDRYENDYIIGILRNFITDLKTQKPVEQVIDFYAVELTAFKAGIEIGIMRERVKELVRLSFIAMTFFERGCPNTAIECPCIEDCWSLKDCLVREGLKQALAKVEGL